MWKLVFFVPLLALTVYIVIKAIADEEEDADQKEIMLNLATRMLVKGRDYLKKEEIDADFKEYDFTDKDRPQAFFDVITDLHVIPFEARDGKLIRHRNKE